MADTIQRGWAPVSIVARQYLGIAPDVLTAAIKAGELAAYEKPITRGRKPGTDSRHHYFVSLADVDVWIRGYWTPANK